MPVELYHGDCLAALATMADNSVDSCVCDPPYGLSDHKPQDVIECLSAWIRGEEYRPQKTGFMGRSWDAWVPGPEVWREVLRVLKPGGHLLAFAGTRSMDLMSMAIRLAGFELRDSIGYCHDGGTAPLMAWVSSSGMPKSKNVALMIDKSLGHGNRGRAVPTASKHLPSGTYAEEKLTSNIVGAYEARTPEGKPYEGFGTGLKPCWEPILIARKPMIGTIAQNVLAYGTGAYNIDACRVPIDAAEEAEEGGLGRWPANVIRDDSEAVEAAFAAFGEKASGKPGTRRRAHQTHSMEGRLNMLGRPEIGYADKGSASRFFYCSKASKEDRAGSKHPTVKPLSLMRYLCRLVTPPGGTVLDIFGGSGTTGQAAVEEGLNAILCEREDEYVADICHRLALYMEHEPKKV